MVKITLYGYRSATCTQRILILLNELELKYEIVNIDLTKKEQKSAAFLEIQPFGKVPAIKYGKHIMFESRAILRYLARDNADYVDLTLGDSAQVETWLEAESQNYNPPISDIVFEKMFKKMYNQETDENVVKRSLEKLEAVLSVYENRFSKTKYKYIAGNKYSIADISHIPYTNYFIKCGYENILMKYPLVYEWYNRIISREAVKSILQ
jgi:glutathione S-transferase